MLKGMRILKCGLIGLYYIIAFILVPGICVAANSATQTITVQSPAPDSGTDTNSVGTIQPSADEYTDTHQEIRDPLEPVNRYIYKGNKIIDKVVLNPINSVYRSVIPKFGREMIHNALTNLQEPVNGLNAFLQGNADDGSKAYGRFMTNSIIGIGGLFDVAKEAGLESKKYGFGSTLNHYDIGIGPYFVVPILGPSSTRETIGKIVDLASNPFNYVLTDEARITAAGMNLLDTKDQYKETAEAIEKTALDEYATVRSLFSQQHQ